MDSQITRDERLDYVDFESLYSMQKQELYSHLRYFIALYPDTAVSDMPKIIKDAIDNSGVCTMSDLIVVLRGANVDELTQLSDLRIVLDRRNLNNPSRRSIGIPTMLLQLVGKGLEDGMTFASIATETGVDRKTISKIDDFLGISRRRNDSIRAYLQDALDAGLSTRKFSNLTGLSKSRAARIIKAGELLDKRRTVNTM